jgi:WD40 repeat protein
MSDNHQDETEHQSQDELQQKLHAEHMLEARIAHTLQNQAAHIQFTGELRTHIMQNLPVRRIAHRRRFLAPAFALAAIILIVFSTRTYLLLHQQPSLHYTLQQVIAVPPELAQGGQLLSLDPTGQHLVYQPAHQSGVMYTANVSNPLSSNILAMRYAHTVGWSPDGTELITTVLPEGATNPLLALVRIGEYMKPLGPDAEAASWSPTSTQQILYTTQSQGHTLLWATTPDGQASQHVTTMNVTLPVQQMVWSHDGQKLALLMTNKNEAGDTLSVMDARTHILNTIVTTDTSTISAINWSPDKHYLTYQQSDVQGHTTLHAVDIDQHKELFALTIQKMLAGWSWSPDSNALVYSDGGTLHTYTLHGITVQLPHINATQEYPFWLKDGRILYMNVTNAVGKLAILAKNAN